MTSREAAGLVQRPDLRTVSVWKHRGHVWPQGPAAGLVLSLLWGSLLPALFLSVGHSGSEGTRRSVCPSPPCFSALRTPLATLQPQGRGQASGRCRFARPAEGGVSLTRPGPRPPCPAETASCGWCTPASLSAGRGPPARNHTLTCTRGLAAAARRGSRGQVEGELGREAAHSEVTTRWGGMVRCTAEEEVPSSLLLFPGSGREAAQR